MNTGARIKQLRKSLGLTQKQLADKVGIKQPTVADLENGHSAGSAFLASIANVLNVNALWLETGKGDPGRAVPVTDDAKEQLLRYYEALSPPEVARLLDYAQDLFKIATYNKQQEAAQNKPEIKYEPRKLGKSM